MPALLQVLKSVAPDAKESTASVTKPKLYVLAVGISNYDNPGYRLQYAAKDATDFAKAMQKQNEKTAPSTLSICATGDPRPQPT